MKNASITITERLDKKDELNMICECYPPQDTIKMETALVVEFAKAMEEAKLPSNYINDVALIFTKPDLIATDYPLLIQHSNCMNIVKLLLEMRRHSPTNVTGHLRWNDKTKELAEDPQYKAFYETYGIYPFHLDPSIWKLFLKQAKLDAEARKKQQEEAKQMRDSDQGQCLEEALTNSKKRSLPHDELDTEENDNSFGIDTKSAVWNRLFLPVLTKYCTLDCQPHPLLTSLDKTLYDQEQNKMHSN